MSKGKYLGVFVTQWVAYIHKETYKQRFPLNPVKGKSMESGVAATEADEGFERLDKFAEVFRHEHDFP